MNRKISEFVGILIELLQNSESKQIPQKELESEVKRIIQVRNSIDVDASAIIQHAQDNWIVDKILDYDDRPIESVGQLVWFFRTLTEEETKALRNLPEIDRYFLKILHGSNIVGDLGVVRADEALKALHEQGFEVEYAPYIPGKTNDFFRLEEGKLVQFYYLVPEDEKSEEYKVGLRDLDEKTRKKLDRKER